MGEQRTLLLLSRLGINGNVNILDLARGGLNLHLRSGADPQQGIKKKKSLQTAHSNAPY